jgi:hypothetical protein
MSGRLIRAIRCWVVLVSLLVGGLAQADMLFDKNVMATMPATPKTESFNITQAGTLSVTISDLGLPQMLQSLSFAIADSKGVLKRLNGVGTLTLDIAGPQALFLDVYASPNASIGFGLYHIDGNFVPSVPLPFASWLLLSGLLGIGTLWRKHVAVTNP